MQIVRSLRIVWTLYRFGLDELLASHPRLRWFSSVAPLFPARKLDRPLPERVRLALESLGPIFVKFGQVLSTRRDLLPPEYADELAKLQDRVEPFSGEQAKQLIEQSLKQSIETIFFSFEIQPVASASVAQVHRAFLKQADGSCGREVAVKVLRPGLQKVIEQDLALMRTLATFIERYSVDGKRLKPKEVVAEFDGYLHDELDLMHEAANASQLRRNFIGSSQLLVPEVFFDLCTRDVLVLEWMKGVPIGRVETLRKMGVDMKTLAKAGVEIFFTQVFRHGFFHADMHPGNIFVAEDGRYIALDFGIVGGLTEYDKHYLAVNFLAFFNRDYHRVATAHIESGWVPPDTRAEALEAAVRTVCEPIFEKPLSQISFGLVLLRLFETSRRFHVEIQPQLVLLQKTLLNIEGLGRQLDPDLDLWETAKPFLTRWMDEQMGWRGFVNNVKQEAPQWVSILPQLPRRFDESLQKFTENTQRLTQLEAHQMKIEQQMIRLYRAVLLCLMVILFMCLSLVLSF